MPPWTALVRNATTSSSSSSTAADYTPLPASPSPSSTLPLPGAATRAGHALRTRRRLVLVATAASTLFLVASLAAIVPDKHLPSAVTTAKQGVVDAAAATWRWDAASTANEAQELADELTGEDHLADLELPVDDVVDAPSGSAQGAVDPDWREPSSDEVECPASAQAQVGQAGFWAVTETSRLQYLVAPREPLDDAVPSSCLSQAVFSARLVSVSGDDTLDNVDTQTLVALDRPRRSVDQLSYFVSVPSDVAVPLGPYQLDVHLAFGFFPGALDGVPCGDEAETCVEGELGAAAGEQLRYVGERVEVLSGQVVHLGQEAAADLALCTDLSSLAGHWSSLAFFPTSPPCTLATPTLPLPFLVDAEARPTKPLWLHVVGDSNARNMFTHLAASLGEGRKVSASKVLDSPTHNGTHASVAFRYRDGAPPVEDGKALPDVVVTWQWWYEASPVVAVESAQHEREDEGAKNDAFATAVAVNRDDLVSLVDTDLASFLRKSRLASALKHSPALKAVARMVRPHRTYLSLGSHGEQLSLAGVSSSLDALFAESSGLSRAARDRANLRLFTTTLVDARYIPLARFPHQDLVRNNALVEAKNAFAARHPALGGEWRVIDVEALTRGIVDSDGWMKAGRHGPDAVHFRGEVYDEWVRLVWTDLLQGVDMSSTTVEQDDDEDDDEDGVEAMRRRWKRRLSWDESLAEDDDDDDDGL